MASASSKSAKNLFQDSRRRLSERVQSNVNSLGSVVRRCQRGSHSAELLQQTAKQFCQTEPVTDNSFNGVQRMQVIMAQMNRQLDSIEADLKNVDIVREKVRDVKRQ